MKEEEEEIIQLYHTSVNLTRVAHFFLMLFNVISMCATKVKSI